MCVAKAIAHSKNLIAYLQLSLQNFEKKNSIKWAIALAVIVLQHFKNEKGEAGKLDFLRHKDLICSFNKGYL